MFTSKTTADISTLTDNFFSVLRRASLGLMTLFILFALSAPLLSQGRGREIVRRLPQDDHILINPLPRDDPRAQLEPQLRNALPMPTASDAETRALAGGTGKPLAIEIDLATGEEKRVTGLDGYYKPFLSAFSVRLRYYQHGTSNIGLVTLDRPIGSATGWLGYGSFSDSSIESYTAHLAGYSLGKEFGRLYYGYNWATTRAWDWLTVATFFQPGEMGAGIYLRDSASNRYVHSVAAGQSGCATAGDRLTDWIFSRIQQVIASGQ